ncbi:hypothetical protein [Xanthobacter sediminis]
MNIRTRDMMVTFDHPFRMSGVDDTLPAGTYHVAIDEEQLLGRSFIAYRAMATMLYTPAVSACGGTSTCLSIDPAELDAAVLRDRQASEADHDVTSPIAAVQMGASITGTPNVAPFSQRQPRL